MTHDTQQIAPLNEYVRKTLEEYFKKLGDCKITNLYKMVLKEVEPPLFKTVMDYTKNNQSSAAAVLGVNRGTLRKKLKQYKLEKIL